jgi:hypothetical protein
VDKIVVTGESDLKACDARVLTYSLIVAAAKLEVSMRRILRSALLCVGTSVSGYTDLDTARRAYAAVPFSDFYPGRDQRSEMAAAIQAYWQEFDGRLPKLTPSELEWIT